MSSSQPLQFKWEGVAGRTPERFVVVRLERAAQEGGGLFGLRRTPSFIGNLPDAVVLEGKAVTGEAAGREVVLRAPGGELPALARGDRVALGLVEGSVCIGVLKVPAEISDAHAEEWAARQGCGA